MRTLSICVATLAIMAFGCDDSDNKGTSAKINSNGRDTVTGECANAPSPKPDQVCTGEAAYTTCIESKCGTEIKKCMGAGWESGNSAGGLCADAMTCRLNCPCDAKAAACEKDCGEALMKNTACLACFATMGKCTEESGCTEPVCTDPPKT